MKKPGILLADDDADDRFLFREALKQIDKDIRFHSVNGGVELMDYLESPECEFPDLLFLDLNMPKKNGFECLEEIRQSDKLRKLNVIIYSTSSQFKDVLETVNKGANLYFTKPASYDELVTRLTRILKLNWDEFIPTVSMEKFIFSDGMGF